LLLLSVSFASSNQTNYFRGNFRSALIFRNRNAHVGKFIDGPALGEESFSGFSRRRKWPRYASAFDSLPAQFIWRVQPDGQRSVLRDQFAILGYSPGASADGNNPRSRVIQGFAQRFSLDPAKRILAVVLNYFFWASPVSLCYKLIQVNRPTVEQASEFIGYGRLARSHEADDDDSLVAHYPLNLTLVTRSHRAPFPRGRLVDSASGKLLDTRHARVLNPRSSVAFGVQKAETHTHRGPQLSLVVTPDVTLETTELKFPSRIEAVDEAAAAVSEFLKRLGIGEDIAFGVDMAVREAVTNAVIHGNKLDDAKVVEVKLKNTPEAFEISVHDQGSGFNPNDVPDPTKDENILRTSGRGIFFMRNFMDEVDWSREPEGGTKVRMIKKL